ncbi:MAG TPA: lysylphosphatidylglycerol synthase domain-containing protein, partial [Verrucomicrobiota bacterium]|nr:hypothetical protein [Verrucomicrobiales bacterium]HRI16838.1 lysylphosphatidylglycerol synthase domain-containing protein [Verrucomicrobiota bacterium]
MRLAEITGFGSRLAPFARHRWVAVGVSASILALIFWRIHPERILQALAGARALPASAALLCVLSAGVLLAVRWQWMLRSQGVNDGFFSAWRGVLVGNALNAAMLGAALSDVAKSAWYARRHRHPFPDILLACGLDRVCGGVGVILYALATIAVAIRARPEFWDHLQFNLALPSFFFF